MSQDFGQLSSAPKKMLVRASLVQRLSSLEWCWVANVVRKVGARIIITHCDNATETSTAFCFKPPSPRPDTHWVLPDAEVTVEFGERVQTDMKCVACGRA